MRLWKNGANEKMGQSIEFSKSTKEIASTVSIPKRAILMNKGTEEKFGLVERPDLPLRNERTNQKRKSADNRNILKDPY